MSGPRAGATGAATTAGDLLCINTSQQVDRLANGLLGGEVLVADPFPSVVNPQRLQMLNPQRVTAAPSDSDNQVNYDLSPANHRGDFRTEVSQDTNNIFLDGLVAGVGRWAYITFIPLGAFVLAGWPVAMRWLHASGAPTLPAMGKVLLVFVYWNGTELMGTWWVQP